MYRSHVYRLWAYLDCDLDNSSLGILFESIRFPTALCLFSVRSVPERASFLVSPLLPLATAHIFGLMDTPTPAALNEQHVWGGTVFTYPDSSSNLNIEQPALLGYQTQAPVLSPSSQARFIASSSDDLFHPVSANGGHSFSSYHLPPVPYHHAYNLPYPPLTQHPPVSHIPINRNHLSQPPTRPLPYPLPNSSYNNPTFTISPQHDFPLPQQNSPSTLNEPPSYPFSSIDPPFRRPLGPPPPLPPRLSSYPDSTVPAYIPNQNQLPSHPYSSVPVQYIYCLPPPSSSSSSPKKTLPSVTHISTLTNKLDFFA